MPDPIISNVGHRCNFCSDSQIDSKLQSSCVPTWPQAVVALVYLMFLIQSFSICIIEMVFRTSKSFFVIIVLLDIQSKNCYGVTRFMACTYTIVSICCWTINKKIQYKYCTSERARNNQLYTVSKRLENIKRIAK